MNLYILKTFKVSLLIIVCLLISCSKDEVIDPYDVNYVYVRTPLKSDYLFKYKPEGGFVTQIEDVLPLVPVRCTKPASEDITVQLAIDNSLVAMYNREHEDLPIYAAVENVELQNTNLTIKKGMYVSQDTIKLVYKDKSEFTNGKENFLIPITIKSVRAPGQVSKTNIVYLSIKSSVVFIDTGEEPQGDKLTDTKGWKIMIGNKDVTSILTSGEPATEIVQSPVYIDFGKKVKVSTIALNFYKQDWGWRPRLYAAKKAQVEMSEDGVTYSQIGTTLDLPAKQLQYLQLYTGKEIRYLKIVLKGNWAGYGMPYLTNLYIYADK
ncbi:BT_3987 domain-containing protein [Bacteroides pyogenes]|uniref:DUF1735 domain-containing protein n=1 Tax=Bacteroides pyogenes TaxID=310300 RepID=A0A5D3FUX1_9BACE|nr:DUF1735 domain-containing protein [Bacteroides pyogenes]TYK35696.1 DUF1735 domain-containing protein [Bacteroides pyogenes]TYK51882.1 DUF1735 domain-containing protein [Bacteroides pyogenes]